MSLQQDLLLSLGPFTVLASVALLLLLYLLTQTRSFSGALGREPPGPRPLPLLGNLLQLNLSKPQQSLCEVSPIPSRGQSFWCEKETRLGFFFSLQI